jgi:hypothetical protein
MDPLSALSLAGTIVQFVDFGCKLFTEGRELYKSSTGQLSANEETEMVIIDLQRLMEKLRQPPTTGLAGPCTEDEHVQQKSCEKICDRAISIAEEIISRLEKLMVKGSTHRMLKSIQKVVKSAWSRAEISGLMARIQGLKATLETQVLFSIR